MTSGSAWPWARSPARFSAWSCAVGMNSVGIGLGLGMIGAFAVARVLRSQLFGVTPTDGLTYGCVVVLLAAVGIAACVIPARRAAKDRSDGGVEAWNRRGL